MTGATSSRSIIDNDGGGSSAGINELLTPVSTLDEPVGVTIMRDVRAVGAKLRAVLLPLDRSVSLFFGRCILLFSYHSRMYTLLLLMHNSSPATIRLCQCPPRRTCQSKYPSTECTKSTT